MSENEAVKALNSIGLTLVQAKVYLAIVKASPATILSIAKLSKVPRTDIYRITSELQEIGIVEKTLTVPAEFHALPIHDATDLLILRRKEEIAEIERIRKDLLLNFKKKSANAIRDERHQFFLLRGRAIFKRYQEQVKNACKTCDIVTTPGRFLRILTLSGDLHKLKMNEGVVFRVITRKPVDEKAFFRCIGNLAKHTRLQLKYTSDPIGTIASIYDNKAVLIGIHNEDAEGWLNVPRIYTTNPVMVKITQNYFENLWNNYGLEYSHRKVE